MGALAVTLKGAAMPTEESGEELQLLEFHTTADWVVTDLISALDALEVTYTSFSLARYLAERERADARRLAETYLEQLRRFGPDLDLMLYEWTRILRRLGPVAAVRYFSAGLLGLPGSVALTASDPTREIEYYFANPTSFLSTREELSVKRIEMASPGGFSLRGMGEPIKEIRELIKDLCYRNRQEKDRGDLEILEQKLALAAQNNLTPQQLHMLAVQAAEPQNDIKALIYDGKLTLAGEEPRPIRDVSVPRRRRRKKPSSKGNS